MTRQIANDFGHFSRFRDPKNRQETVLFYLKTSGKTKTHERVLQRESSFRPALTDTLFSFTATRDSGFRFQNGQFAMIGLEVEGRPLLRAYSMASANHEEELEFFSIKVATGR